MVSHAGCGEYILSTEALTYIAKDDAILCRGDLYVGLDVAEIMWRQHYRMWALN